MIWALNSIDRCEVAILMIDAKEGVKAQDKKIASHILKRYAGNSGMRVRCNTP